MANRTLNWDKTALLQLSKVINYIAKHSVQNADKVRCDILEKVERLPEYPEMHPPDKNKKDNDGSYRAFELHRLRIAYFVGPDEIRIVRLRSTHQEPLAY
jgi:plasmid stabilization system protein ParE